VLKFLPIELSWITPAELGPAQPQLVSVILKLNYRYWYPKFIPISIPDTDTLPEIHTDTDISHFPPIQEVILIPDTDTLTFIPDYTNIIPIPI